MSLQRRLMQSSAQLTFGGVEQLQSAAQRPVAKQIHDMFMKKLQHVLNEHASLRASVLYMRMQPIAIGVAQVEFFSRGIVSDAAMYYSAALASAGAQMSQDICVWDLQSWGSADTSHFRPLLAGALEPLENQEVMFLQPGVESVTVLKIKKAA